MSANKNSRGQGTNQWSQDVDIDSTHPPKGLFTEDAETIAKTMAKKEVSPQGLGSAIKMVQMYSSRAGKNLDSEQRAELEKAKHIVQKQNDDNSD